MRLTTSQKTKMKSDYLKELERLSLNESLRHERESDVWDDNFSFEDENYGWFETYLKKILKSNDSDIALEYEEDISDIMNSPEAVSVMKKSWKKSGQLRGRRVNVRNMF